MNNERTPTLAAGAGAPSSNSNLAIICLCLSPPFLSDLIWSQCVGMPPSNPADDLSWAMVGRMQRRARVTPAVVAVMVGGEPVLTSACHQDVVLNLCVVLTTVSR